ncbi:unnamed protein product [Owenia fusiformis]|uniref:Uncharacterized protein n=1 Tax=Owenia fusiformis TaxID=6347 RepID=A0A8S4PMI5_OWEFU|nr:unnamed protein product [Owenia fusiformis]
MASINFETGKCIICQDDFKDSNSNVVKPTVGQARGVATLLRISKMKDDEVYQHMKVAKLENAPILYHMNNACYRVYTQKRHTEETIEGMVGNTPHSSTAQPKQMKCSLPQRNEETETDTEKTIEGMVGNTPHSSTEQPKQMKCSLPQRNEETETDTEKTIEGMVRNTPHSSTEQPKQMKCSLPQRNEETEETETDTEETIEGMVGNTPHSSTAQPKQMKCSLPQRPSVEAVDVPKYQNVCIYCNQVTKNKTYEKSRISEEKKATEFLVQTQHLQDEVYTSTCHLTDVKGVIEADLLYHNYCYKQYSHKYQKSTDSNSIHDKSNMYDVFNDVINEIQQDLNTGKVFSVSEIYKEIGDRLRRSPVKGQLVTKYLRKRFGEDVTFIKHSKRQSQDFLLASKIDAVKLVINHL